MISSLRALYLRPATLFTYMLQSTEYQAGPYLCWFWRTQNFAAVMHRRTLDPTRRARLLQLVLTAGMVVQALASLGLVVWGLHAPQNMALVYFGLAVLVSYPVVWAHMIVLPLLLAHLLIVKPERERLAASAADKFADLQIPKIAVVGSYGKTSMKELLVTVLSQGKKVAATPANKNVMMSHAAFARTLDGSEEGVIVEFGEGAPGDVAAMSRLLQPDYAVITGLAPAHLDAYKTLEAAGKDIMSVTDFVDGTKVYANGDSSDLKPLLKDEYNIYAAAGLGDWKVSDVDVSRDRTSFTLSRGKDKLRLRSGLLGRHQIGPLAAAAVLGLDLGLTKEQVTRGIAKTKPYEHRMQPYQRSGAWVIDDTYNGNLEGIRAGTALLAELDAKRKWYVTPGLVDQGKDSDAIHRQVGALIAAAKPDIVVLMKNSTTASIQQGLSDNDFAGELRVETDPLDFYVHLDQFVGAGDLVMMQNDWTDNYA